MKIFRALRVILAPVSLLYLLGFYVKRLCARPWSSPVPVVCIGNITTGGTGKTPVVIRTASALRENGFRPGVVSRGYRGRLSAAGAVVGDGERVLLSADAAGEEAVLIAGALRGVPVVIGADRRNAISTIVDRFGVDCIVMDDGFQNTSVRSDVAVLVVDATDPFGGGLALPAGNLREPATALRRGDYIILNKCDLVRDERRERILARVRRISRGRPMTTGRYRPRRLCRGADAGDTRPIESIAGSRVLLVSGIGNPAGFRALVGAQRPASIDEMAFPDHHAYSKEDVDRIGSTSCGVDMVLTTEKDIIKLRRFPLPDALWYVPVDVVLEDERGFVSFIADRVRAAAAKRKKL